MFNFFLISKFWRGDNGEVFRTIPEAGTNPNSGRKKASRWFAVLTMAFCLILACKENVWAAESLMDNFDSYSTGSISGQGNWNINSNCPVSASYSHSNPNSLFFQPSGYNFYYNGINLNTNSINFWYYIPSYNGGEYNILGYEGENPNWRIAFENDSGNVKASIYNVNTSIFIQTISQNTWHHGIVEWTLTTFRFSPDNGITWSDWIPNNVNIVTNIDTISGYSNSAYWQQGIYLDDFYQNSPSIPATLTLNTLVDAGTSNWNFWDVNYDPKNSVYDTYGVKVCYGYNSAAAVNCTSFVDRKMGPSGDCDNATSTDPGHVYIPVQNELIDGAEYHIKVFLYGTNELPTLSHLCADDHLIAVTDEITQTFTGNFYLTASGTINTAQTEWDNNYSTVWGAASSSIAYTQTTGFIGTYIQPTINKIHNMGGFMNASTSQDAGVAAGVQVKLLFQTLQNVNNFVPGFPFLTWILVYYGFLIGIGLWRWGHKTIKIIH